MLVSAGAASRPTIYVPARNGGWPGWLAGPFEGLGIGIGTNSFQALMLIMCASYLVVLLVAERLPLGAIGGVIVLTHLILLLGPPLISQDVFGYLDFARLGATHGLDPYTHVAADAPTDPAFTFVGWYFEHSPYGPLFTLASYAVAPLGLAAGLWALKAVAVAASLAGIAMIAAAAGRMGHSRQWAAAFVGLNPVLLVMAVGGAHNDTLLLMLLAAALVLTAGSSPRLRSAAAALVVGVGVKVTAGLALPFIVLSARSSRERLRVATSVVAFLLLLGVVGVIGFGVHALGFLNAVSEQQQMVASHSIPAETARLFGLKGTPEWWRHTFLLVFLLAGLLALWRTARGADWRVAAGWSTLALLFATAWLLPWYVIWALPLAAVSRNRSLCVATLIFCAYAVLIHLPLANPLLSPPLPAHRHHRASAQTGDSGDLTGFQVAGDVVLYLPH
jgi:alpha-1,6-mannosyltransferase